MEAPRKRKARMLWVSSLIDGVAESSFNAPWTSQPARAVLYGALEGT